MYYYVLVFANQLLSLHWNCTEVGAVHPVCDGRPDGPDDAPCKVDLTEQGKSARNLAFNRATANIKADSLHWNCTEGKLRI